MKRRKQLSRVDAILTADWHLRDTTPTCRVDDDFWSTLWGKVKFVADLQLAYNCPVFHAGDLIHHWKPSPRLLSMAIECLPDRFHTVYGNHDLPQRNLSLREHSGVHTLEKAEALTVLPGAHSGQEPDFDSHVIRLYTPEGTVNVLVWHEGVWQGEAPWPDCPNPTAIEVLEDHPEFDLIVTGDFHIPVVERLNGRVLINPGSLMRQSADQIDFRPRVYLWSYEKGKHLVYPSYLPIDITAVSREHLDQVKERDKRIQAFVERLSNTDWGSELNFEANVERAIQEAGLDRAAKQIVYAAIEEEE